MSKQRHIYHLVFTTKRHKMTIPMDGKEILLDRMIQIFSGKGCYVYAANAFLNHMHILVEIPQPDNFNKIVNKVKSSTGTFHLKYPEYADFPVGLPGSIRSASRSAIWNGSDVTSRNSRKSIRISPSKKNTNDCLKNTDSTRVKYLRRHHTQPSCRKRLTSKNGNE